MSRMLWERMVSSCVTLLMIERLMALGKRRLQDVEEPGGDRVEDVEDAVEQQVVEDVPHDDGPVAEEVCEALFEQNDDEARDHVLGEERQVVVHERQDLHQHYAVV